MQTFYYIISNMCLNPLMYNKRTRIFGTTLSDLESLLRDCEKYWKNARIFYPGDDSLYDLKLISFYAFKFKITLEIYFQDQIYRIGIVKNEYITFHIDVKLSGF